MLNLPQPYASIILKLLFSVLILVFSVVANPILRKV